MTGFDRITFDQNMMSGRACIRGMRVTVSLVLGLVAQGMTASEIIEAYPYLEDEDIRQSLQYAAYLRMMGHEAVHLFELHLERLPDPEIIEKARSENRVILTHDLDFSDIMAAGGERLPSVVTFRLRNMQPDNVNRYFKTLIRDNQHSLEEGALISISEARIRVRRLPIEP